MPINMNLFLRNVYAALINQQYSYAQFLLTHAIRLTSDLNYPPSSFTMDVSIGLHRGRIRDANEDCILALQGVMPRSRQPFGLFLVCDGIGGHLHGQEASHLAIRTILEALLPQLLADRHLQTPWEILLCESIQLANQAIYVRNQYAEQQVEENNPPACHSQESQSLPKNHHMGTTVTAVLLIGQTAHIANVGDSRTYVYHQSLSKITRDHSLVAELLANGLLEEEQVYTHPHRNQITRSLGTKESVEVDTFVVSLRGTETLLLCSDGLWEMTRDRNIEEILSSSWSNASFMTNQLVQLANNSGGADNIGCIVVQLQRRSDISSVDTMRDGSLTDLARQVLSSSWSLDSAASGRNGHKMSTRWAY